MNAQKTEVDLHSPATVLDQWLARPMFVCTLLFLAVVAAAIHTSEMVLLEHSGKVAWLLGVLYLPFPLEAILFWVRGRQFCKQNLLFCIFPPARLGARDHRSGKHLWLPYLGWQRASRDLAQRLIRFFSLPMIVIALLVVPIIIFDWFFEQALEASPGLRLAVNGTSAFIWMCFVVEFVIVVSVVDKPWRYCRHNWLNLVVIVLVLLMPIVAFLRMAQLGRLVALKQLVRTTRLFRLRGLLFRAWRAFVTLEMIDLLLRRSPAVRLERTRALVAEKLDEIAVLRQEIARLEQMVKASPASGDERGGRVPGQQAATPASQQTTAASQPRSPGS